jgi:hypothetical protein
MPAEHIVVTQQVAEMVERYVEKALADARRYENSSLLDESGVYDLHCLAARIYAAGFDDGDRVAMVRARGVARRAADAAGSGGSS